MTEYFQAKDIQLILKINKIRYEYLASKISITPDIEEVEGTGRAHLYSFKNLLQFAIAHNANKLGLPLREVKKLFEFLEDYQETVDLPLPQEVDELKDLRAQVEAENYPESVPVLSPKEIRERLESGKSWPQLIESDKKKMLSVLDQEINSIFNEWKSNKLFASGIDINLSIYCAYYGDFPVIFIKGNKMRYYHSAIEKIRELKKLLENSTGKDREEHGRYFSWGLRDTARTHPTIDVFMDMDTDRGSIPDIKSLNDLLDESDGYLKVNLGKIKNSINSQLKYE